MKKILAAVAVLLVVGGAAAGYFYFKGSDKHLLLIPKDAFIVASVDFRSIGLKADFAKVKDMEWVKAAQKKGGQVSTDSLSARIMDVIRNPLNSGVNLMSDVYFFGARNGESGFAGGMVFDIKDADKFEASVRKISPKSEIVNESGYKMVLDKGVALAWSDKGGIVAGTDRGQQDVESIKAFLGAAFKRSRAESILANDMFMRFDKGKKDASFFMNGSEFLEFAKRIPGGNRYGATAFNYIGDSYKDVYTWAYLNFGDDKVSVTGHVEAPKGRDEKFDMLRKTSICTDHQNLITDKNVYALAAMNIDMDKVFAYYETIPMIKTYEVQIAQTIGMSVKDFQNILGGEISVALVDVKKNDEPAPSAQDDPYGAPSMRRSAPPLTPVFVFNFSSRNKEGLSKLLAQYTGGKNPDGFYSMPLPGGYVINAVENKIGFTVTNGSDLAKTIASKGTLGPLPAPLNDLVKNNASVMYMDLNADNYPDAVKGMLADAGKVKTVGAALSYMKLFKDITITGNTHDSEMDLNFNKGEGNTLSRMLTQIDVVYKATKADAIQ